MRALKKPRACLQSFIGVDDWYTLTNTTPDMKLT